MSGQDYGAAFHSDVTRNSEEHDKWMKQFVPSLSKMYDRLISNNPDSRVNVMRRETPDFTNVIQGLEPNSWQPGSSSEEHYMNLAAWFHVLWAYVSSLDFSHARILYKDMCQHNSGHDCNRNFTTVLCRLHLGC